jgi:iron complex outermembrane receptor protein
VLDEDPPLVYSVNANTVDPQYDIPGRFWYVQFTQKF